MPKTFLEDMERNAQTADRAIPGQNARDLDFQRARRYGGLLDVKWEARAGLYSQCNSNILKGASC